jgi:acyl-CoA reductase-like NAD-dependent aldehyde dehydrogenase
MPLTIEHFRYFAACARAQEGSLSEIDHDTIAYHFHEPLGVVGQIIPWNFPILMAAWKLAPALAAGNCVGAEAGEQTPMGIMVLMDLDQGHPAARRAQLRRTASASKPASRLAQSKRIDQGRLHRRDHDRPPDHAVCAPRT